MTLTATAHIAAQDAGSLLVTANRSAHHNAPLSDTEKDIVGVAAAKIVHGYLDAFPHHASTPLVGLPDLARSLGLGGIDIKDEGQRYGMGSFKALGGGYAVGRVIHRHLEARLGRKVAPAELLDPALRGHLDDLTVACATDGNHGRSVASGAQKFGVRCVIFLHQGVSQQREDAIARFGAEIRRTAGNYDDSVAEADRVSKLEGWTTVSDFSREGYEDIPGLVMQGYSLMLEEIDAQHTAPYSHIFIQGGVGGLAAAVAGHFHDRLGADRPRLIVVEPDKANCLQRSAEADRRMEMAAGEETVMAMLECYEPSLVAWRILEKSADSYISIPDQAAVTALKTLARPTGNDPALTIGESGGSGLAGLLTALADPEARRALGLGTDARILLIGTEGATDPDLYEKLLNQ